MKSCILLIGSYILLLTVPYTYAFFKHTAVIPDNTFASGRYSLPSPTPSSVLHPAASDVVINEINWGGSRASTSDEWVELRNMLDTAVDVSGWRIENLGGSSSASATLVIPSGKIISAHGYFLIANAGKQTSKINVDPDMVTTSISLLDTGEELRIRSADGTLIDTANRNGTWYKGSKTPVYRSMERVDIPGNGGESNAWLDAATHTGMDGSDGSDEFGTPRNANGL